MGDTVFYRDFDFIPILRFVFFELLVRTGDEVITALQLRLANENAAVRVHGGAEFQLEIEIIRKLACRPQYLHQPGFSRMDNQKAIRGGVTAITAGSFAVEIVRLVTPARKVFAIEQTDVTG